MVRASESGARVMVVDDDPKVRSLHAELLGCMHYEVETAADGIEALAKLPLGVDLVLLDNEMPNMDGFEVARRIRESPAYATLPIVMVTGLTGPELRRRAMEVGINDFVTKPLDADELALRSRWLLELKRTHDRLNERNAELVRLIQDRTAALRGALAGRTIAERSVYDAHLDTIKRLAVAAEYKDSDTAGHIERVGAYAGALAAAMGLPPGDIEKITHATPMHDVGKLAIPDHVLLKPGPLDEDEWVIMRSHAALGAKLLAGSSSEVIQMGERIAMSHHERFDGAGYPQGLRGDAIPLEARICTVVDVFDALTMDRPYRKAFSVEHAMTTILRDREERFDPAVRDAFLRCLPRILELREAHHPDRHVSARLA